MANDEQLALLKRGSFVWNTWLREARATAEARAMADSSEVERFRPDLIQADLRGANLEDLDLRGADLVEANLSGANLSRADLSGATLVEADLSRADLTEANLSGATLHGANLTWAELHGANLSNAQLVGANLSEASLRMANLREALLRMVNLTGANLSEANLSEAHVVLVRWDRARMRGRFGGIRGIDSCYGNALFKRSAADQDFLDTLEASWAGSWRALLFRCWGQIDYGRSLLKISIFAFGLALIFGIIYSIWPQMLGYQTWSDDRFTPFYFSIVTYTIGQR